MTETLVRVSSSKIEDQLEVPSLADAAVAGVRTNEPAPPAEFEDVAELSEAEFAIVRELVRSARPRGVAMTGPGRILKSLE